MAARVLRVRALSTEEEVAVRRLAHSRTEPARRVERARIIWLARAGRPAATIARELGIGTDTVRLWLKRFNAEGLAGLADRPRSGRPATYTPEQVGEVIGASLTKPDTLGLPFGSWTLDRLAAYLNEEKGVPIKRSRIDEILLAEGLRWRTQETWFGERAGLADASPSSPPPGRPTQTDGERARIDPQFAQKRGRSLRSTRHRLRVVS
jgi:transposase